jgi:PAS domain S-box-containing protein
MKKLFQFINPIARLGVQKYSYFFPFAGSLFAYVILDFIFVSILRDHQAVGTFAIFLSVALIIYFAFRDGIRGGILSSTVTIIYYIYLVLSLHYKGAQFVTGMETIALLSVVYYLLGGIVGWLKQTIDQLIEREANGRRRLEAIIQQLPVGVVITDADGRIVQQNRQVERIFGSKFPIGLKVGNEIFFHAKSDGKTPRADQMPLAYAISTGKSTIDKEFVIKRGLKFIYVNVNASAIRNKHRKIIAAAEIVTDITPQKEMENRKDDFLNMASHELKTPITSLKLYVDLLLRKFPDSKDPNILKTLHNIKTQTNRLHKLVDDLLDVSRLQTGKLTFEKEIFRVDELVKESVEEYHAITDHKLILKRSPALSVCADRFRIYQVLTNLMNNAVKYSPNGKPITLNVLHDGPNAIICVQDHGIGIEKLQQKKIFDRLYQVEDNTVKTYPGFGMGLYISREIVKRHGGRMWVESEKGKGSAFYFSLPLDSKKV